MIIERYDPVNLFELVPQLPKLQLEMEPELVELDQLLQDDEIFQRLKADMAKRYPHTLVRGRHSTPVEVILRMLIVRRLYDWSYEQTEHFVSDSLVLRQFCRLYLQPVPDDTTLIRWANLVGADTLTQVNHRIVELAKQLKVTRGRKLRVDSTVVQTNIHYPTDSAIVGDGVRVLSRLLHKAKAVLDKVGERTNTTTTLLKGAFRSRTRSVRRIAQQLHRVARGKGEEAVEQLKAAYAKLLDIAQATHKQANQVHDALVDTYVFIETNLTGQATKGARHLISHIIEELDHFLPLVSHSIEQAQRRVLQGEAVRSGEKLLSLFEPHTQVIQRHKAGKPTEFGRKLWLGEVEGGIISEYRLLDEGGGLDLVELPQSLAAHQECFGHPPDVLAGDRGTFSAANEALAHRLGVKQIVLPHTGRVSKERQKLEHERWFRRGFRFRAGIEGRIRVLKRDYGLETCLEHGEDGMWRRVGWGIVTANLAKIAETQTARARGTRWRSTLVRISEQAA
jgi:transposase, IS5 family